jgi:threonylcarbamoyladenosine tRNA methylthiotransferase MtaB
MPDACIGVDVIVGYPAETPERFENTFDYLEALPATYFHVFTYSERPDTPAVAQVQTENLNPVPKSERTRRNRRLRLLSEKKRQAFYRTYIGESRPVLWEDESKHGLMLGFTDNYIRVERPFDAARAYTIESVRLDAPSARGHLQAGDESFIPIV